MNRRNTEGEAIFVRDTATYEAPQDDDPVPGSLRLAQYAQAQPNVMSDAAPAPSPGTSSPAPRPSGQVIQGPWQPRPMPTPPTQNMPVWLRYGRWGLLPLILMLGGDTPLISSPEQGADSVEQDLYRRANETLDPFDHSYNLRVRDWYQSELARYRAEKAQRARRFQGSRLF
jgi:hypothetical protein